VRNQRREGSAGESAELIHFCPPFIVASRLSAAPSWASAVPSLPAAEPQVLFLSAPPCLQPARPFLVGDERPVVMVEYVARELRVSPEQALRRVVPV
jgi:hypothetical protein